MRLTSSILASLRFFESAARLLSFKLAALELHVTQGAVSQQIKHLEDALGCALFQRLPRQIKLTAEGQQFAAVVAQALNDIVRGANEIVASGSTITVRLRVGPSFAFHWLVPRLGDFYVKNPHIRLFVLAAYDSIDPEHREFDLAVELMEPNAVSLNSNVLMDEYLVPICTPRYLKEHGFLKRPEDLERCTLLHDAQSWIGAKEDAEWRLWLNEVGASRVDSTKGQFFSLSNLALEAALSDQGIAMGRKMLITDLLNTKRLVMPFKRQIKSLVSYCLVCPKELTHRPAVQAVVQWLREQAAITK